MYIDRELQTSEKFFEDRICQSIVNKATSNNLVEIDENNEEQAKIVVKLPLNKEVLEVLRVLRRAVHH